MVKAGDTVIYSSDFETATDPAIYNGGCREGLQTAQSCTDGWQLASAAEGSPAEHAYLLEMRDRSGFDLAGRGESDRGTPTFAPGVYLAYTDENHGYGNVGTDDPPAQTPLDAQPEPGSDTPNLDDAAFKQGQGFSDAGAGHVDNYTDPSREDGQWRFDFDCLGFDVTSLAGGGPGPETSGTYDLVGDVAFRTGSGCGPFDYGSGTTGNAAPTASAQVKRARVTVGTPVIFDGSGSFDDRDAPEALTYAWDFEGDGTADRQGRQVRHSYGRAGIYTARLTVTDSGGKSGTATVPIVVVAAPVASTAACAPGPSGARVSGGRLRFPAAATVDVLRGSRVVKRFAGRTRAWNGRGLSNGVYVVRTEVGGAVRRTAFERRATVGRSTATLRARRR